MNLPMMTTIVVEQTEPLIEEDSLNPGPEFDRLMWVKLVSDKAKTSFPVSYDLSKAIFLVSPKMRKMGLGLLLEDLTTESEMWAASFGTYACQHSNPAFAVCVAALKALKVVEV